MLFPLSSAVVEKMRKCKVRTTVCVQTKRAEAGPPRGRRVLVAGGADVRTSGEGDCFTMLAVGGGRWPDVGRHTARDHVGRTARDHVGRTALFHHGGGMGRTSEWEEPRQGGRRRNKVNFKLVRGVVLIFITVFSNSTPIRFQTQSNSDPHQTHRFVIK